MPSFLRRFRQSTITVRCEPVSLDVVMCGASPWRMRRIYESCLTAHRTCVLAVGDRARMPGA